MHTHHTRTCMLSKVLIQPPKRGQKLCSQTVLYSEVPLYLSSPFSDQAFPCRDTQKFEHEWKYEYCWTTTNALPVLCTTSLVLRPSCPLSSRPSVNLETTRPGNEANVQLLDLVFLCGLYCNWLKKYSIFADDHHLLVVSLMWIWTPEKSYSRREGKTKGV